MRTTMFRSGCRVAAFLGVGLLAIVVLVGCPTPPDTSGSIAYVIYDSNGATGGSVPSDTTGYPYGQRVTVAGNSGYLEKSGFLFSGWNTRADGTGSTYAAGQQFTMGSSDVTLFARWLEGSLLSVTYDGNGSTAGEVPVDGTGYAAGQAVTVPGNPGLLENGDFTFVGWSTEADGTGITYAEGQTFTIGSESVTLYARWLFYLRLSTGGPYVTWVDAPALALEATDNSGDVEASYTWDLDGDGVYGDATGASPVVTWSTLASLLDSTQYPADPFSGLPEIEISVRVTYDTDRTAVGYGTLIIYRRQPVAVPHWSPQPYVPIVYSGGPYKATVHMDNSGSYDGDPDMAITAWECKLSGSATWTGGETSDLIVDLTSSYPFPVEGLTRTFFLKVTDTSGAVAQASFDVRFKTLAGSPPSIVYPHPRRGVLIETGESLHVDASATTDPDGYGITRVQWDADNDGTWDIDRAGTVSDPPSLLLDLDWAQLCSYPGLTTEGSHIVKIAVTNAIGVSATDSLPLTIVAHAVIPAIDHDPALAGPGDEFTFDGSRSRHLFPGGVIAEYAWDLDDDGVFEESGVQVTHVFGRTGTLPVTLRVTDGEGRAGSVTTNIVIE